MKDLLRDSLVAIDQKVDIVEIIWYLTDACLVKDLAVQLWRITASESVFKWSQGNRPLKKHVKQQGQNQNYRNWFQI